MTTNTRMYIIQTSNIFIETCEENFNQIPHEYRTTRRGKTEKGENRRRDQSETEHPIRPELELC